jgi:hypothetical protein
MERKSWSNYRFAVDRGVPATGFVPDKAVPKVPRAEDSDPNGTSHGF